jgi:hypothetical protein
MFGKIRLRNARKSALEKLDIDFIKAQEQGQATQLLLLLIKTL